MRIHEASDRDEDGQDGHKTTRFTMALGLAKFYRITLNEGKTFIKIEQETEQIRAYIDIQHIRYADRFSVSYNLDPGALHYKKIS